MKTLKSIVVSLVKLICLLAVLAMMFGAGYLYRDSLAPTTVTEKMMDIQRQVGCVDIDGIIGSETTPLVNAAVKEEEQQLFNQYASVFMTGSGAPK